MSTWSFILSQSNLTNIGEIVAMDKTLELTLNRGGSLSFTTLMDHDVSRMIAPLATCILAVRKGRVVWEGPVMGVDYDFSSGKVNVSAVGWFDVLNRRYVESPLNYTSATDAGQIAAGLLANANAVYPTGISVGTIVPTINRIRSYLPGASIGGEITALSDIESGFDFEVEPMTRRLNIRPFIGADRRTQVSFGFNAGTYSLSGFTMRVDGSSIMNRAIVSGPYGTAVVNDVMSQGAFGVQAGFFTLSDVNNNAILAAYAGAEVAVRRDPKVTYSVIPRATLPSGSETNYKPFDDYKVGDIISITAKKAGVEVNNQAARVFGMSISVDNNGNEKVNSLKLANNG